MGGGLGGSAGNGVETSVGVGVKECVGGGQGGCAGNGVDSSVGNRVGNSVDEYSKGALRVGEIAGEAASEKLSWLLLPTSRQSRLKRRMLHAHVNSLPSRQQTTALLHYLLLGCSPQSGTSRHAVFCSGQHGCHVIQLTTKACPKGFLYEFANVRQTQTVFELVKSTEQSSRLDLSQRVGHSTHTCGRQ